ncbi:MAG: hypothetical protein WAL71_17015 [Terriglobales bacterium]|jgi:hypothetical protein
MCVRNAAVLLVIALLIGASSSFAIPAFSRQYGTSCTTCHIDFPKLNDFGKAFKDSGFKFPKNDEDFIKIPPVMLGAPAQKEMFPKVVWPGTIPGIPQVGLRFNQFFQYTGRSANNYYNSQNLVPGSAGQLLPPAVPRTDFEPGFFSIFMAGNFGSDIAFWVDDDLSVSGANANGGLGDGYLRFLNIGRFFKLPTDSLTLQVGQFELDLPFTQARSINISPYDIYTEANISVPDSNNGVPGVNNISSLQDAGHGIELSGGHPTKGYHYSLAIVDQNTSNSAASPANVPSPTGGSAGGVGFFSDSNFKDLYANVSYRFNLEKDSTSRNDIQAAGQSGPRDHTYLSVGAFSFYGKSDQRFSGYESNGTTQAVLSAHEPFYRAGGDFSFNYRTFNLFGLYMYGHDQDLLLNSGFTGFTPGPQAKFNGGFLEADYLVLPWVMGIMRWDRVQSSADFLNGIGSSNYYSPVGTTRDRITPGVQFLIHANIKASFEYQFRPEQALTYNASGQAVNPFRTNTATGALEFVY